MERWQWIWVPSPPDCPPDWLFGFCKICRAKLAVRLSEFTVPNWSFFTFYPPPNWPSSPRKSPYPHKLGIFVKHGVPHPCTTLSPPRLAIGGPRPPKGQQGRGGGTPENSAFSFLIKKTKSFGGFLRELTLYRKLIGSIQGLGLSQFFPRICFRMHSS